MKTSNNYTGVYAITDGSSLPLLIDKTRKALKGGATIIQYRSKSTNKEKRLKEATALNKLCKHHQAPLLINDDVQLAYHIGATGVHLGADDMSLTAARSTLGESSIIGISCYNQLDLAIEAEHQGADYIAFGSMFASPTKPNAPQANVELLIQAKQALSTSVCCIGGITLDNAPQLLEAGADMLAVISAVFNTKDIQENTQEFANLFK